MVKKYVIVNPYTNQYFTGRYWYGENEEWTRNYEDAKFYNSEEQIIDDFKSEEFENIFENINFLKIEVFYTND